MWGTYTPCPYIIIMVDVGAMATTVSPTFPSKVGVGRVTAKGLSAGQSGCVSHVLAGYSQAVDRFLYSLD